MQALREYIKTPCFSHFEHNNNNNNKRTDTGRVGTKFARWGTDTIQCQQGVIQYWQRRRFFLPKKQSNKRWGTYNRSNISLDSGIANISRSALKICKNITSVLFHSTLVLRTPRYLGSQTPDQSYEEKNRKTPATTESRTLHVVFNWHFYCSCLVTRDNLDMLNEAVILHLGLFTSLCTILTYKS